VSVSLKSLLDGIADPPGRDARIEDLAIDSRQVRPGSLFFALRGGRAHGLEFAADAAARGASAILWEPEPGLEAPALPDNVVAAPVARLREAVGRIADRFHQRPSASLLVVGVTGTNGKTTCAYLLAQALERLGTPAAYMGTIGWGRVGHLAELTHTTPDAPTVHRSLAELKARGVSAVAMEVSSQALDQGRVEGVAFRAAAFTNLTRDHLDYHATMQAYGDAKARLFAVPDLKEAVINVGDAFGRELSQRLQGRVPVTTVWIARDASRAGSGAGDAGTGVTDVNPEPGGRGERILRAEDVRLDVHGISMRVSGTYGEAQLSTRLMGRFNAENLLVVLGCLVSLGVPLAEATAALAGCHAPPGRMEVIEAARAGRPLAVIDYAHTPDALAKALDALREHCRGALWCVFGCGGDRDPGKRPLMGAVADERADRIIVTDDNPRSENPLDIIQAITAGIEAHAARVIPDRSAAIAAALNEAAAADMVLIAGKGHEDYQIYGATRRRFSDRDEALKILGAAA
jgi:UDP-N-acetylmuramoyl-L-alanyl-D-glutamate--2,6-diaminopimelate ligase